LLQLRIGFRPNLKAITVNTGATNVFFVRPMPNRINSVIASANSMSLLEWLMKTLSAGSFDAVAGFGSTAPPFVLQIMALDVKSCSTAVIYFPSGPEVPFREYIHHG